MRTPESQMAKSAHIVNMFAAGERASGIPHHPRALLAWLEVCHCPIMSCVASSISTAGLTGASCCARFQWFDPARVYDLFPEIIAALNIFSLAFCVFLYVKVGKPKSFRPHASPTCILALRFGAEQPQQEVIQACSLRQGTYAPSSTDSGSTGSLVNDIYWGALSTLSCAFGELRTSHLQKVPASATQASCAMRRKQLVLAFLQAWSCTRGWASTST